LSQQDIPVWGIHTGKPRGQSRAALDRLEDPTDGLFKEGFVAIGWPELGDLARLPKDRGAFRDEISGRYGPGASPHTVGADAGMLYRFVHEMQQGDLVVFRSRVDGLIHIGRITGPYQHDASRNPHYHHLRPVEWLGAYDRDRFTSDALRALRAQRSLFQIKAGVDEYRAIARSALH
jgi:restriction system protein